MTQLCFWGVLLTLRLRSSLLPDSLWTFNKGFSQIQAPFSFFSYKHEYMFSVFYFGNAPSVVLYYAMYLCIILSNKGRWSVVHSYVDHGFEFMKSRYDPEETCKSRIGWRHARKLFKGSLSGGLRDEDIGSQLIEAWVTHQTVLKGWRGSHTGIEIGFTKSMTWSTISITIWWRGDGQRWEVERQWRYLSFIKRG